MPPSPRSASLARGTYPFVLTEQGLSAALALAAADAPVSTTVVAEARRYAAEIENAVYFCCLEALQNASKHAGEAAAVRITVAERDDSVWFDVQDNGAGFDLDAVPAGVGLTNIRDRVAAVRGRVTVESTPGLGTRHQRHHPAQPHPPDKPRHLTESAAGALTQGRRWQHPDRPLRPDPDLPDDMAT